MSARPFPRPRRAWPDAPPVFRVLALLLGIGAGSGLGCVRTTSLGGGGPADAPIEQHDGPADRTAECGTDDAPAERGSIDRADASSDRGPIVGGGRDADSDGSDDADDGGLSHD